jgi:hypothetical protein
MLIRAVASAFDQVAFPVFRDDAALDFRRPNEDALHALDPAAAVNISRVLKLTFATRIHRPFLGL